LSHSLTLSLSLSLPLLQVGACIVSPDRIILGIGYNGFPRGCPDDALPWAKRAPAWLRPGTAAAPPRFPPGVLGTKYPYVCHAEMNAILNKNAACVGGATLYVTMFPCNECSKLLIQAGIREVVFYEDKGVAAGRPASAPATGGILPAESYAASRTLLDLAGVRTRQHAPAAPVVLRVEPLQRGGGGGARPKAA
jgi:dCMP deaminase